MLRCCPAWFKFCHFPGWVWFWYTENSMQSFKYPPDVIKTDKFFLWTTSVVFLGKFEFDQVFQVPRFCFLFFWGTPIKAASGKGLFQKPAKCQCSVQCQVYLQRDVCFFRLCCLWSRWWWTYHVGWVETAPRPSSLVPNHLGCSSAGKGGPVLTPFSFSPSRPRKAFVDATSLVEYFVLQMVRFYVFFVMFKLFN